MSEAPAAPAKIDVNNLPMPYRPSDARIAEVAAELAPILKELPDLIMKEDTATVLKALRTVVPLRTEIEKARVQFKADSLAYGRRVDAEAKRLTDLILAVERPLHEAKTAIMNQQRDRAEAKVREQEEKERKEREAKEAEEAARRRAEEERLEAERKKLEEERAAFEKEQAERRRVEDERLAAERKKLEEEAAKQAALQREADRIRAEKEAKLRAEQEHVRDYKERLERIEFEQKTRERLEREAEENAKKIAAKKLDEERRAREEAERVAAEEARLKKAEEERLEHERKAEEEARPDVDKVRAVGHSLEEWMRAQPGSLHFKHTASFEFLLETTRPIKAAITALKNYKLKKGSAK